MSLGRNIFSCNWGNMPDGKTLVSKTFFLLFNSYRNTRIFDDIGFVNLELLRICIHPKNEKI